MNSVYLGTVEDGTISSSAGLVPSELQFGVVFAMGRGTAVLDGCLLYTSDAADE